MTVAQMLIFGGPTGVGKGTIKEKLNLNKHGYKDSVSWTTRRLRHGEKDGIHYHFKSKADFHAHWKAGKFLETNAENIETWTAGDESLLPKWYGTPLPKTGQKSFYEVDSDGINNLVEAGSKANKTMKIVIILPPGQSADEQVESSKQRIISRAKKNLSICISECPEEEKEKEDCESKCTKEKDFLIGADLQDRVNAAGVEITKLNDLYNRLNNKGINVEKFHNDNLEKTTGEVQAFIDAGVSVGGKRKRKRTRRKKKKTRKRKSKKRKSKKRRRRNKSRRKRKK